MGLGIIYFILIFVALYYSLVVAPNKATILKFRAVSKNSSPDQLRPWALCFISSDFYGFPMDQAKPKSISELEEIKQRLMKDWELDSDNQILQRMDWLRKQGFRTAYPAYLPLSMLSISNEDRERILDASLQGKLSYAPRYANILAEGLQHFRSRRVAKKFLSDESLYRGILAWDMSYMLSMARLAAALDLISAEELEEYRAFAEAECKKVYNSWEEIAAASAIGILMEEPSKERAQARLKDLSVALWNPRSPWRRCTY